MTDGIFGDAVELLEAARRLYADDDVALGMLAELDARLHDPLRLAIAGIVKAGKSTLLNAMLGEQIAPTDAGECTRVVTWYRYADSPSVTLVPISGPPHQLAIKRVDGKLVLDLGEYTPEEVDRIDVAWPSRVLKSLILIDTPGIASLSRDISARSTDFLTPADSPSSADAIVYLLRHLHPSDVKFLESFRDTAAGESRTVNSVAVLSRADEVGSGRIDSMLSARKVAKRYEVQGELASLVLGVIPVAGLLAEAGRTLRESEFAALRELADLDRAQRERLLLSADRFIRPGQIPSPSQQTRAKLLARLGIFGVRLAVALIRAGTQDSTELSTQVVQQSGLRELTGFIERHFGPRTHSLKVRAVLDGVQSLLRSRPPADATPVVAAIERISATHHSLRELTLLSDARVAGLPLRERQAADAVRIVGGNGTHPAARLGLEEDVSPAETLRSAEEQLAAWRALSQSPLIERAGVQACRVVVRSLEELVSVLRLGGSGRAVPDVVLAGGPGDGTGEGSHQ